ncbi:hypothetical protein CSB07_00265 [Candidatus Gracilibacteria bacterium]|nr:MAG: hypothetical protein CSB07_00265 [Candidatus Gracilibacteria bacterium]PIE85819.1 MAG: hypothetical protein CSA08_00030 [Candidatus Gracilibacteria bacterium]
MYNIFYENLILIPAVSFLLAVFIKTVLIKKYTGKWDFSKSFSSGGMPSSHSALIVSLATAVAIKNGIDSDLFAVSIVMTAVIISDAINIRFEAGLHAGAINKSIGEKRFKESLGHLPSEAFAGSMLGIIVAVIMYYL